MTTTSTSPFTIAHPKFVVTVTGADDAVDPAALVALSRRFPFVEWGILVSATRDGTPRYPSSAWRERLVALGNEARFSAHLCGRAAKSLMAGVPWCPARFHRMQINGYCRSWLHDRKRDEGATPEHQGLAGLVQAGMQWPMSLILQAKTPAAVDDAVLDAAAFNATCRVFGSSAEVLCDPSAGTGAAIGKEFFRAPDTNRGRNGEAVRVGYAGGIGPENVEAVLTALRMHRVGDTWIDMESGVRSNDKLDLDKVAHVLEVASQFVPWTTTIEMPSPRFRDSGVRDSGDSDR